MARHIRSEWVIFGAVVLFIAVAPAFAPKDPDAFSLPDRLSGPSWQFPLGTDAMGRCMLSRLLAGFHVTPMAAFAIVLISATIGTVTGLMAGYLGGWIDVIIMRVVEGVFIFPAIGIALTASAVMGLGMASMSIALCMVHWTEYARLMRNVAMEQKQATYVLAARAVGASQWRVVLRHILPNTEHVIRALLPYSMSWALLSFSGLSFLGLGAAPGTADWGLMIAEGRPYMRQAPLLLAAPGLMIVSLVIVLNLLSDHATTNLQPHQKRRKTNGNA